VTGDTESFDRQVRRHVYDQVIGVGTIPTAADTATALSSTPAEVTAAFQRLAAGHMLVLQQDNTEILMANPFSAVPTAFQVQVGNRSWWGNCVWDALGIAAMLKQDARIVAACGDCSDSMVMTVKDDALADASGIAHFSVAAKRWWDNIVFT
jgi:Alkylmercury lyase